MKLSARNQLAGIVLKVAAGAVNGLVTIDVNGTTITSDITMSSIRELGIEPGKNVLAVVKASEVMVGLGDRLPISARNQIPCTVVSVDKGPVNAIVKMEAQGGSILSANITRTSAEEMGLAQGSAVLAVIKSSSVMIGLE